MKKNNLYILLIIPIIVFFILLCQNLLLNNQLKTYKNKEFNNTTSIPETDINKNSVSTKIYNCKFTQTYRIVDLLENYIAEGPEYSYIVVDQFQVHNPMAIRIPTQLKINLEKNKYYEFTYHITGTGNIKNIYDIINNIYIKHLNNGNLSVTLSIKETTKTGLEQTQQNICK